MTGRKLINWIRGFNIIHGVKIHSLNVPDSLFKKLIKEKYTRLSIDIVDLIVNNESVLIFRNEK